MSKVIELPPGSVEELWRSGEHMMAEAELRAHPRPLEETDPELAEHFRLIANQAHPACQGVMIGSTKIGFKIGNKWRIKQRTLPGRNDPCSCGSGKKFKKCCLR